MDLHLPDMSGFQVLIRFNPIVYRSLHTPVIALPHFTLPSIIEAAKKPGAQDYLISLMPPAMIRPRIQRALAAWQ